MSELKALVDGLRGLEPSERRSLVARRLISLVGVDDLYSLAEALNTPKSYAAVVGSLSHSQLETLAKIARKDSVTPEETEPLRKLLLIYPDGQEFKIFDYFRETLKEVRAFTRPIPVIPIENNQLPLSAIDQQAGIGVFQTIQALTEVVFDLEKHLVREVGKGNVGLPDVKRLASALACTNDRAKSFHQISSSLGLTSVNDGRHRLTSKAISWLQADSKARLELLVGFFCELLGTDLLADLRTVSPGTYLPGWLQMNFPFAQNRPESRIGKILGLAEDFGLTVEGYTATWFTGLLVSDANAMHDLLAHLPANQGRVILQPDGSMVAPGPLETGVEARLRRFVETESIGLASTYRLTPLSLTHGLELGEKTSDIRDLLVKLSGGPLPQPIEYLLGDVEKRFGRLLIGAGNHEWRSQISSDDTVLLTEIANDSRLKPFALHRQAPELLACRFEPSVVYFGLRECGFLAIRVDDNGRVISPITTVEPMTESAEELPMESRLAAIFKDDEKLGILDSDELMVRQIQLAVRNKALLLLRVRVADGTSTTFELLPSSIANGRLRGKDRKAQIERTLPLSSILELDLA